MKLKDLIKLTDPEVIFKGRECLLIGDRLLGWAIATKEEYENFLPSYAHLFPDGRILRHGVQIGTVKDLRLVSKKSSENKSMKTLTQQFEEILTELMSRDSQDIEDYISQLIQAVKKRDQAVLGQDKHWSYKDHDCRECRGVNKRVHKIAKRMEETI